MTRLRMRMSDMIHMLDPAVWETMVDTMARRASVHSVLAEAMVRMDVAVRGLSVSTKDHGKGAKQR